ncbi:MAG: 2,3,4,5-tetrahydropyridine-2,6-dicarboxylate N-succinyltransferase, partial [Actinomycetota bacterium]
MTDSTRAWGFGLVTVTTDDQVLDAWFPAPQLGSAADDTNRGIMPRELTEGEYVDDVRGVRT